MQQIRINLHRPPGDRWDLTPAQCSQARDLLRAYRADLGLSEAVAGWLQTSASDFIRQDYRDEMESLAARIEVPTGDAVLCNFYYDLLKAVLGRVFGCSAFAVESPEGILHARNLDWWSEEAALARHSAVCRFVGAPAGEFTTIGWPGFIGAFSGVAPGRFAVTLNAVLSLEPPQLALPVVLLIRTVLEEARTYDEAKRRLSETPIPCDCLLLLSGTRPGEMVVIERTPTQHAIREARDGAVIVTNGYQKLDAGLGSASPELLGTWCQRYERVETLVRGRRPQSAEECFGYLSDPEVRMKMTVQQMVFRAATGECWVQARAGADG